MASRLHHHRFLVIVILFFTRVPPSTPSYPSPPAPAPMPLFLIPQDLPPRPSPSASAAVKPFPFPAAARFLPPHTGLPLPRPASPVIVPAPPPAPRFLTPQGSPPSRPATNAVLSPAPSPAPRPLRPQGMPPPKLATNTFSPAPAAAPPSLPPLRPASIAVSPAPSPAPRFLTPHSLPPPRPATNVVSSVPPPAPIPLMPSPRFLTPRPALPVNPFSAKAAFVRYWNRKVHGSRLHPPFFFAKLSPLSALDAAVFTQLAAAGQLASRLRSFCAAASILCPSTSETIWTGVAAAVPGSPASGSTAPFRDYQNGNFSSYGNSGGGGSDAFAVYSRGQINPVDSFHRYGKGSLGRNDSFTTYEALGNVGTSSFNSYTAGATGGSGEFAAYDGETNTVAVTFGNYDTNGNGRGHGFSAYTQEANTGEESFAAYGKAANSAGESFATYGNHSNSIVSEFVNYGDKANSANDTFASYGASGNAPANTFRSYSSGSNGGSDEFKAYRENANVGDDSFTAYAAEANGATADFDSYGKSVNPGSVAFKGYGQGSNPNHRIGFAHYAGDNTTFKAYSNDGVEFKEYQNMTKMDVSKLAVLPGAPPPGHQWAPEPGKFFRERDLVAGNRMPLPDITDKLPPRAFLPRDIAAKIPFEADAVSSLFGAENGTAMRQAVATTVAECARPPSRGETKRCATSAEDVLDFAVETLGDDVTVRTTESTAGAGGDVRIGKVAGVAGGLPTRSVSCHQSMFPYLVYYCHSVPSVRVYEAEIMALDSGEKINRGVAICHLDTSDWSPNHGAFVALGGIPGEIEVCHWIFQGDMTWTAAD